MKLKRKTYETVTVDEIEINTGVELALSFLEIETIKLALKSSNIRFELDEIDSLLKQFEKLTVVLEKGYNNYAFDES